MISDEFRLARYSDLTRYLDAQKNTYATVLSELRSGKKLSHWIWYVFPQLRRLGHSYNSDYYGLMGLAEAREYLAHALLGDRLREATEAMLNHQFLDANSVLGELDALKFRSCLTLFSIAAPSEQIFADALERLFDGERDVRTVGLLKTRGDT